MHNFELVFFKGDLVDEISERDSWQDSVIVAFVALFFYWMGVIIIGDTFGLDVGVATSPSTLVLFWLISYSFWRVYTKPVPDEFQLHFREPVCSNCGMLEINFFCQDCLPLPRPSNQMPNHFGKLTMRRINIISYFMLILVVYNFIILDGRKLLLWDVFPNVSQDFDLLINILVSMMAAAFYTLIVYLSTSVLLLCFGNTTLDELNTIAERSNEYETFFFGSFTRKGKIAYLRWYKDLPLPFGKNLLIQRMNPAESIFFFANWMASIVIGYTGIILVDEDFFNYPLIRLSSVIYYLAVFYLILIHWLAVANHLQDSREQIFQRVSHLFVEKIEVELIGTEDE